METQKKRPPCAIMTVSAVMEADCAALKKIVDAGMEVVVVPDKDFEEACRIVEKVRRETLAEFKKEADYSTDPFKPL